MIWLALGCVGIGLGGAVWIWLVVPRCDACGMTRGRHAGDCLYMIYDADEG